MNEIKNTTTKENRACPVRSTTFQQAGGWAYCLHVHEAPANALHVHITSRWAGARDPEAERSCLRLNLSRAELQALIAGLQAAL